MQTTPLWAKALQISKASIEEWLTVAPIEESFTFWCLFTGRLSLSAYFEWAKETYGLAYLEEGYFKEPPNHALWKQIHSVANWSPWMLPIEQWDGVVFIACVEPPTDMQWSFPVAFVLADPNLLEQRWQRLHTLNENGATATLTLVKESDSSMVVTAPVEAAAPVPSAPTPTPAPATAAPVAQQVVAPPPPAAQKTPPPIPTPEINITKNAEATNFQPAPEQPQALPKIQLDDMPLGMKQTSAPENDGSPAGLNLSGIKMPDSAPPPIPLKVDFKLDLSKIDSPVPLNLEPVKKTSPINLEMPEATPAPIKAPNIPKATAATPIVVAPTPVSLGEIQSGPINIAQAPDQIEAATTEDACLAWFFKQVRTRYSSGIALLFSKNSLHTWKWDSTLTPKNPANVVTFDTPSLFRIAARTMRSYHGYVVDNPAHQTFFQAWGMAKAPVHVTGAPILINSQFRGLFVCSANEPMGQDALEFIEMVADKTVMQLEKVKGVLGKAA